MICRWGGNDIARAQRHVQEKTKGRERVNESIFANEREAAAQFKITLLVEFSGLVTSPPISFERRAPRRVERGVEWPTSFHHRAGCNKIIVEEVSSRAQDF